MPQFQRGLKLYGFARQRAKDLGMVVGSSSMNDIIWQIQKKEGNITCFRKQSNCSEILCCWQASCGAKMFEL